LARTIGDEEWVAAALTSEAYTLASLGDLAGGIRVTEEASAIFDRLGQSDRKVGMNAARLYYGVGDFPRAIECAQLEITTFSGPRLHERTAAHLSQAVRGRVWLALTLAELGDFEDAGR